MTRPHRACLLLAAAAALLSAPLAAQEPARTGPRLLNAADVQREVEARYPRDLRAGGIGGVTRLSLWVGTDGTPGEVGVDRSSGHAALDSAAVSAGREMRFQPATEDGAPAGVRITIPLTFRADRRRAPTDGPMSLPGAPWAAEVTLPPGFRWVEEDSIDGLRRAAEGPGLATLQVWLSREAGTASGRDCREAFWRKARTAPLGHTDVRRAEAPPIAYLRYRTTRLMNIPIRKRFQRAFYGADGVCLDLQFTVMDTPSADETPFQAAVDALRIVPVAPAPAPAPADSTAP
jgi:TonB family protein